MIAAERLRDRALVIPVAVFIALTPPVLWAFAGGSDIFGVPLLYAYVFTVWLLAIVAGAWAARRLIALEPPGSGLPSGDGPPVP